MEQLSGLNMNRKSFLQLTLGFAAGSSLIGACRHSEVSVTGEIIGANAELGHKLRDAGAVVPTEFHTHDVVIIGAGISGLSAARKLMKEGITDFTVLELEKDPGGNSKSHYNGLSAFPLGAHYIPIPNNDLTEYLAFLQDLQVITGFDPNGLPVYNELFLCFEPEERLFINGKWQEGIVPDFGVPESDKQQIAAFFAMMKTFREANGKDGKQAFAIPVNNSSTDPEWCSLDTITMSNWMQKQGFTSPFLQEYVNYCTRDDFGTKLTDISAWAAIHYFAARKGKAANADQSDVLTWPEGNAFLVAGLLKSCHDKIRTQCLVTTITPHDQEIKVIFFNASENRYESIQCKQCIIAIPQFIASRILNDSDRQQRVKKEMHYAPWMVATMLTNKLDDNSGSSICWDNVIHGSKSLGYVNATHQLTRAHISQQNLSYYLPLTEKDPSEERKTAAEKSWQDWLQLVLDELSPIHPDLKTKLKAFSVTVWGHAMIQPRPGYISGNTRSELSQSIQQRIHFAHTDLCGISIFEEGFYQGWNAANLVIDQFNSTRA